MEGNKHDEADEDENSKEENVRNVREALHYAVGSICRQEEQDDGGMRMSVGAISALTELVYEYSTRMLGKDLVAFSEHAGRKRITIDDVKLMARKDPANILSQLQEQQRYSKLIHHQNKRSATIGGGGPPSHKKVKNQQSNATTDHLTKDMSLTQQRDFHMKQLCSSSSSSSSSDDDSSSNSSNHKANPNNTDTNIVLKTGTASGKMNKTSSESTKAVTTTAKRNVFIDSSSDDDDDDDDDNIIDVANRKTATSRKILQDLSFSSNSSINSSLSNSGFDDNGGVNKKSKCSNKLSNRDGNRYDLQNKENQKQKSNGNNTPMDAIVIDLSD